MTKNEFLHGDRPILSRDPQQAAGILRAGGLVAFPTETVYGLGVDATHSAAVARLFAAKGRPSDNPLIVHLAEPAQLPLAAREVPTSARLLLERFAPGPLTVVVPKQPSIVAAVTAGLDTVGVRIPDNEIARDMLRCAQLPIAAPSANQSGRPSTTTSASVLEEFEGRIDLVLEGQPSRIGLESTVVDCVASPPRVLRPGAITQEQLREVIPQIVVAGPSGNALENSPGRRHRHYQPQARVLLFNRPEEISIDPRGAYVGLQPHPAGSQFAMHQTFGSPEAYAAAFYETLRRTDRLGLERIYCQMVSPTGIGAALMDRLSRAAE